MSPAIIFIPLMIGLGCFAFERQVKNGTARRAERQRQPEIVWPQKVLDAAARIRAER